MALLFLLAQWVSEREGRGSSVTGQDTSVAKLTTLCAVVHSKDDSVLQDFSEQ